MIEIPEEKIFTIRLREAIKKERYKRSGWAARHVREYLMQHTKAKEVKLGQKLNSEIWARGAKKPAHMVRVRAIIDGGVAKAELIGHDYVEFRASAMPKKEGMLDKLRARMGEKAVKKEEEEKMVEGKTEKKEEVKTENKDENKIETTASKK